MERNHVDLFSGIGGFALASQANGIKTVQFVEIDQRCRNFLSKTWEGVAIHDDIKTFEWKGGPVYLLTGGVPCQPASRAGKQKGDADNRWLWPYALQQLYSIRPTWAIFENPPGIGDVGLAGILSDVEGLDYEVRVFGVPACAVGAPHRRERYWIVAHCERGGCEKGGERRSVEGVHGERKDNVCETPKPSSLGVAHSSQPGRERPNAEPGTDGLRAEHSQGVMADTERSGSDEGAREPGEMPERTQNGQGWELHESGNRGCNFWQDSIWLPCADGKVRRAPDDTLLMAHGLPVELSEVLGTEGRQTPEDCEAHRSLLGALGNSIVPQVAEVVIRAIVMADEG